MIAADQMIKNLSMKIGEVDSGSARLLFLIIWSLLKGVKVIIHQSLVFLNKDSIPVDLLLLDLLLVLQGDPCR